VQPGFNPYLVSIGHFDRLSVQEEKLKKEFFPAQAGNQ